MASLSNQESLEKNAKAEPDIEHLTLIARPYALIENQKFF